MASGRFSKQAVWTGPRQINANNAFDNQIGGTLNTFPGGVTSTGANQGFQTLPGDRVILSPSDALVWSNNNVGNLYTGTFRYVAMRNNSTATPERGRAAFWDLVALSGANNISSALGDELYQVTPDEGANASVAFMAGVYINNVSVNNNNSWYWWIQESGKASCRFVGNNGTVVYGSGGNNNLAAGAAEASGVYLAAASNANNQLTVGLFNTSGNANATTNNLIDNMIVRYVGPAETTPTNGNISLVDITLSRASFRW
jgi:hypothetical protein